MFKVMMIMFTSLLLISCYPENRSNEITKVKQCPKQPEIPLQSQNLEAIDFRKNTITQSGEVRNTEMIGYQFQARSD